MLGVPKSDIDASFKADRFTVSWHTVHETERVEGRMVYREREEKHHSRTIQVPEKTKVCIHSVIIAIGANLGEPSSKTLKHPITRAMADLSSSTRRPARCARGRLELYDYHC